MVAEDSYLSVTSLLFIKYRQEGGRGEGGEREGRGGEREGRGDKKKKRIRCKTEPSRHW